MNQAPKKKSIAFLTLGTAVAATLGTASVVSAGEPSVESVGKATFMVAEYHAGEKKDGYGEKRAGEGRCGISMADTDKDGRVSKEEHARHSQIMFDKLDVNGDGYIDKDEVSRARTRHRHGHGHGSPGQSPLAAEYEAEWGGRNLQHMKPMGE
ncbi:EF-hand domain-containing protein [Nitrosovibrio sp. Nv17]|jgi:uncharacterized low-complexity protein|uniref:EF-hand domain-containing protein n=1 Tax=Nitrosovibrio sp. Nv17 TaxID=1855339 RepID=UPI000908DBAA|nr:EF-hand domain-containing protein [Nitrosovibrio sp. Nv17]SFW28799.1 EF hand [Nitrosovibrio sp. Nv17]